VLNHDASGGVLEESERKMEDADEDNDVSELVGRLRGNQSGLIERDLTSRYGAGGLALDTTITELDISGTIFSEADWQAMGRAMGR
jgi:hypothetical protein